MDNNLNHLAIIMDGNARWAKVNRKTTIQGHQKGAEAAKMLLEYIGSTNIKYVTLYAFSSENWQRPAEEVSSLLSLLARYVLDEIALLNKHNIRLKVIGELSKLSTSLQNKINEAVTRTQNNNSFTLCIAFSYGGRGEIVSAVNKIIESGKKNITESDFQRNLYDSEMPNVDLLIRTSGASRVSNFLLWQLAYAELYFTEKYWPDFTTHDLEEALNNYSFRIRNFGKRANCKDSL
ncbi:MAG: hypothetical protein DGJ47_000228 [Rickettsiaceae bacterium]